MTDHLKYWKIDRPAFTRTLATRDLFVPARFKPALDRCAALARTGAGLVTVTGEPGTGKTTILRWLFDTLPTETHEVLLTTMIQREQTSGWLLPRLAELLGLDAAVPARQRLQAIAQRLDDFAVAKRHLVLTIDAAHMAETPAALEDVSALLNLHALGESGITVVLAGNDALFDTIAKTPDLAAKTALALKLPCLTREETGAYVLHRLKCAGVAATFAPEALDAVHVRSRGLIATINHLCENVLYEGFQRHATAITAEIVLAAGAHLGRQGQAPMPAPAMIVDEPVPAALPVTAADPELPPLPRQPSRLAEPKAPEVRQESASIKLSSLFKSDPGRSQS